MGMLLCPRLDAAEIAIVGVHSEALGPEEASDLTQALVRKIHHQSDLDAIGPRLLKNRLLGRQELVLDAMALSDGLKKLEEGKLLYDRAEPTQAITELEDAIQFLDQSVAVTGETRHLRDAYLFIGLSHTALGNANDAKRAFAQAVVLDPEMELDPLRYPPRVQQAFASIRDRIRLAQPAALQIQVPEGMPVDIWVDGRKRGRAPLRVEGLPPGRHYIRAVGPGAHRGYKAVGLSPDQSLPVFLPMDQHGMGRVANSTEGRSRQTAALYRALGKHTQTELILVVGETGTGQMGLQLFSTRNERFSKALQFDMGADLADELLDLLPMVLRYATEQGDIRADRVALKAPALKTNANSVLARLLLEEPAANSRSSGRGQATAGTSAFQRYKWWLIGGGAVVVGGTTAAVVVLSSGPKDEGTITVGPIP
jgi:tetratricopeptide (TPR) repeat protein